VVKDILQFSYAEAGLSPLPSTPPQQIATLLLRGREALVRHYRLYLRPLDLTEQQWRILQALSDVPHLEVSELARAATLLGPSLSRILKDLESRRLVLRTADRGDMRKAHIALTASGRKLIDDLAPKLAALDTTITTVFGSARQKQLGTLLSELEEALQELDDPSTSDTLRNKG
jgi:homoprotocatechuate degradation regulator HpaR